MGTVTDIEDLVCRRMTQEMLDSVMYVERRAFEFGWKRSTFRNCLDLDFECWVFEVGSQRPVVTVAHAVLSVVVDAAELLNLTVDPSWQHHGLGRRLLRHLISRARILGATRITLEVRRSNYVAMSLYTSLGFEQVGVRKDYYQTRRAREDALVMLLETGV